MNAIKLALLAIASAGITTATAQTADEIIDKNTKAMGGMDNWNKISSIKMTGSMSMMGQEINMTKTIVNDKGMRMDISAMGMNGYTIVSKEGGWMYMPFQPGMDKVIAMPAEQLKLAQGELNVKNRQIMDRSKIAKAEYEGKDTINSTACYKVKITNKDGNEHTDFFDAATYYIIHSESKIQVQGEEQELAFNFSNFQKQPEGIVVPMTVSMPVMMGDITFKSVEINKPVPDDVFKPTEPKK